MCTAMSIKTNKNEVIFGRTMDFSYELDPKIYVIPKNYEWNNSFNDYTFNNKYKIIATGQNMDKLILVDGMNEMGLGVASLYFQGEAHYDEKQQYSNYISVGSTELVHFLLGYCCDVDEVIEILNKIQIIGIEDEITSSIAPLHWIIVDKNNKCITIEQTKNGLTIYDNPVKVLSNSPNFDWHITNLNNYINLSNIQMEEKEIKNITLKPFGQGGGTFGLPGDYTSPSRFIRTVFIKNNTYFSDNTLENVNTCFNIMKSVTIPKGVIMTKRGTYDYTQYTSFMNLSTGDYYFNTYYNNQILRANIDFIDPDTITQLCKLKSSTIYKNI